MAAVHADGHAARVCASIHGLAPGPQPGASRRTTVSAVRDQLERLIDDARRCPGWRLPSEPELVERLGVGRGSVREALKLLEQEGIVDVVHGSGRYVSPLASLQVERPLTVFESVTAMLRRHGYDVTNRVLSVRRTPATDAERAAFGLADDAGVVRLRRLRLHGQTPLVVSVDTFPAALLADAEPTYPNAFAGSLCEWLAERGCEPVSSAAELRAAEPPDDVGHPASKDAAACPWLMIDERCVDRRGTTVLLSRNHQRGDLLSFGVLRRASRSRSG
jgi:GntR family transcriptional regulator